MEKVSRLGIPVGTNELQVGLPSVDLTTCGQIFDCYIATDYRCASQSVLGSSF